MTRNMIIVIFLVMPLCYNMTYGQTEYTQNRVKDLTNTLIDCTDTDLTKLKSIYEFVIHNISYDAEAYKGKNRRINQTTSDILRRKKAVCWGYAELLREMCTYANLPCYTIVGYSKELPFPARSLENANHAWNAVQINGHWYLIDATWDSGLKYGNDYFKSKYGHNYFLTPPDLFIQNHMPIMPMWQLLDCPVSLRKWKKPSVSYEDGCKYNYEQKIEDFLQLTRVEQLGKEVEVAYQLNKTNKNKSLMGHGLVDIAFEKKEKGDQYLEQNEPYKAMEELQAAKHLFEVASLYCTFYDWQSLGYLYSMINLSQAYFKEYQDEKTKYEFLLKEFYRTEQVIQSFGLLPMNLEEQALEQINMYTSAINQKLQ